jgi:DNA-binding transcriptional LysR family regulator
MDIPALQAFLAVAETGSFSRAGERVFLTQPAISKRIAALEGELGTRLFDRIGRAVYLTPAGETLLTRTRSIMNELDDVRREIANLSGSIGGRLRLGTSHHIGLHRLPAALKAFHAGYPGVQLDLRFMDSEAAYRAVEQGDLELAIATLPTRPSPALRCERLWDDPLEIVVGLSHPLARQKRVRMQTLTEYPAVLPGVGTYTRELILSALAPVRDRIQIAMATNYLEVLRMLAAIGLGWSALPHTLIDAELKVVQIEKVRIRRELGLIAHVSRTLSNAAAAMIQTVKATT